MHLISEPSLADDMELNFDFEPHLRVCHSPEPDDVRMLEDSCFLDVDFDDNDNTNIVQDLVESDHDSEPGPENDDSETNSETDETPAVIGHIEEMVLLFLRQLAIPGSSNSQEESGESDNVDAPLTRASYKIEIPLVDRRKTDAEGIPSRKVLRYPKKSASGSARTFAQLFKVLDLAHEATLSGVPATKRQARDRLRTTDIYYRDVSLFGKQRIVDSLVDDLAATFELERSDLNIRSSSKGVVCGSGLTINLLSGEILHCNDAEGTLIPAGEDVDSYSIDDDVAWVLIIEKEAVFQTLCRLQLCKNKSIPGSGIIITGKGYPDVATRHLVKSLADALPRRIPIMALVDSDPYGLDILSVYKYGSQMLQHENDKLAARRIKWLGLWASELESLHIGKDSLLPITAHDGKKAFSILRRQNVPLPRKWKKQLQYMLHSRRKAEIEIILTGHVNDISTSSDNGAINKETINAEGSDDEKSSNENCPSPTAFPTVSTDCTYETTPTQTKCSPHGLLIRYLTSKITNCVTSAADHGV